MFDTNEYFEGKVKSMAFDNANGKFTVGVMAEGDYEFGTSANEEMTVVSGQLDVLLPGETEWKSFAEGGIFHVAANNKFKVKAVGNTSYLCKYY